MTPKVAILSITRDRLEYTKKCFRSLVDSEGNTPDWYVIDNGSQDGTVEWLKCYPRLKQVTTFTENQGLSVAYNTGVQSLMTAYDYILHFDNDAYVVTPKIITNLLKHAENPMFKAFVLSPAITGIQNQPMRHKMYTPDEWSVLGEVHNLGHLCMLVPTPIYRHFMQEGGYKLNIPKARGHDTYFCAWLQEKGYRMAYSEMDIVQHYRSTHQQALDYPEYYARKRSEQQ